MLQGHEHGVFCNVKEAMTQISLNYSLVSHSCYPKTSLMDIKKGLFLFLKYVLMSLSLR